MPYLRVKMAAELQNQCISSMSDIKKQFPPKKVEQPKILDPDSDFKELPSSKKSKRLMQKDLESPRNWKDLDIPLRSLLPDEVGITYVVTSFTPLVKEEFSGAPAHAFESIIRINVSNVDEGKRWLQSMMKHSKCTYRQTKGRKPGLKRVLYKVEMHCQHKRKPLTPRQVEQKATARVKNSRKILMHELRQKKTDCPSVLKFTVAIPTKKDRYASVDYLVTHPTVLHITHNHNHPIESAHALSFRPIDPETKESFFKLFRMGHSASSAYHWHETKLFLDGGEDQLLLADRATNPTKSDISRLYEDWRKKELGADNGKELFDKLELEIQAYNEANSDSGGFKCTKINLVCLMIVIAILWME